MNVHDPLRSSRKVWLALSIPLFVACWFLRGGKGGDEPYGAIWWVFISGDYSCPVTTMLMMLGFFTLIFGAAAGLAGWVLQFPICMALDYFYRGKTKDETHSV